MEKSLVRSADCQPGSDSFSLAAAAASGRVNQCVIRTYQHVLGGKWKLLVLSYLLDGTRRYGELRRLMPEISEKMLIQELRELEAHRLVQRIQYPEVPPRVEYQLTELGQGLTPIFQALLNWSGHYLDTVGMRNAGITPEVALR
jgi:DNA-binding HxlR family transcriptional regulator